MNKTEALQAMKFYKEKLYNGIFKDKIEAFDIASDAIKKQMPKKVDAKITSKVKALDVETQKIYTYSIVRCPSCDNPMTLHKERKFCEKCGQALDWSDTE